MPFVTEAIWGSLPRRAGDAELLIVARWPGERVTDDALDRRMALRRRDDRRGPERPRDGRRPGG